MQDCLYAAQFLETVVQKRRILMFMREVVLNPCGRCEYLMFPTKLLKEQTWNDKCKRSKSKRAALSFGTDM